MIYIEEGFIMNEWMEPRQQLQPSFLDKLAVWPVMAVYHEGLGSTMSNNECMKSLWQSYYNYSSSCFTVYTVRDWWCHCDDLISKNNCTCVDNDVVHANMSYIFAWVVF